MPRYTMQNVQYSNKNIMRHTEKPEAKSHSLENKKIATVTKMIYPLDLLEKASKSIVLNVLRQIKVTIDKEQKEIRMMYHKIDNTNVETKITRRNKIEIWELTHMITEPENLLERFSRKSKMAEERANGLHG